MRGWWSTRPKAKVWDGGVSRAPEPTRERELLPFPVADREAAATPDVPRVEDPRVEDPRVEDPRVIAPLFDTADGNPRSFPALFERSSGAMSGPVPGAAESAWPPPATTAPTPPAPVTSPTTPSVVSETTPAASPGFDTQTEFLRLLEVVTSMCDHVIEYVESDRAERRLMLETLSELGRVITEGASRTIEAITAHAEATAARALENTRAADYQNEPWAFTRSGKPRAPLDWRDRDRERERVIGGSVPAGPERHLDLVHAEADPEPATDTTDAGAAVDSPVDLGDGTEESETQRRKRERSIELHPSGSDPEPPGATDPAGYWSRS